MFCILFCYIMNDTFESITQYDKSFDYMFDNITKKGYSCSYFAILSCWRFMETGLCDKTIHEENIRDAMKITKNLNLSNGLSFEDLIVGCTTFDHKKIIGTSVDLVSNNVIGIHQMFPKSETPYAVMFLKSEKYFVVLVNKDNYYCRDCHIDTQYNFKSLDQLFFHLANTYQFTENINAGGMDFDEYSSIEFLIFDQPFGTDVITLLTIEPQQNNEYDDQLKQIIEDQIVNEVLKYDLHKDIFELPEKVFLTENDIDYLNKLCSQMCEEFKNDTYHTIEHFDSNEFTKRSNESIDHDELVDF